MGRFHRNMVWSLLLGVAVLTGCGKEIPKDIIQPAQMEDILYDYHLSASMGANLAYNDNYRKEAYKNYVFEKHRVTSAEFDSSMVWYTRHTQELADIYKRVGARYQKERRQVQNLLAMREHKPDISQPGDTVDVWYDHKLYWLTDVPLSNRLMFEIPADSNFRKKDALRWKAEYTFLSERKQKAVMGFNVLFDNDSIIGRVMDVTTSGVQTLYIQPDSAYAIKSINGFIYYTNLDSLNTTSAGVLVNHLSLMRYHAPVDSVALAADSLAAAKPEDAFAQENPGLAEKPAESQEVKPVDSIKMPVRLNPREMRMKERKK